VEIIDHHRLGTIRTKKPIYFHTKPAGSTSTLFYQLYKQHNVNIDKNISLLLAAGILSDTVILKSTTTTFKDKTAITELSDIAKIDYLQYGKEIFYSTGSIKNRTPSDIINADFKIYTEFGISCGIGQVEVVSFEEYEQMKESLYDELNNVKNKNNLS